MKNIAVVGAGLVGSLQAILLAQKGFNVQVYERREDLRKAREIAGRSINLALSDRGWKALKRAGVEADIKEIAIPMYNRCMHAVDGSISYQKYGVNDEAIYSVSRGELNRKLMNLADNFPNISYDFNHFCEKVDFEQHKIYFNDPTTGAHIERDYDVLFGADGAFSAVRLEMQKTPLFDYSQKYLDHGYKELNIPANADGTHKLDKNALHIWPRGEFMMIALPNLDGSFTCTLFFPMYGEVSFDSIVTDEQITAFFERTFPDAIELMPTLLHDYKHNPVSTLIMVRCSPWNVGSDAVIIGDAAHAMVPFYGQGMNCGFEDCTVFMEMFEAQGENWEGLLPKFSKERVKEGNAILDLALQNYVEMRDSTADPDFLLRKKIETKFTKLYPEKWLPLYSQVTFSTLKYSQAIHNAKIQDAFMDQIMAMENIHDNWDSAPVMEKLVELTKDYSFK